MKNNKGEVKVVFYGGDAYDAEKIVAGDLDNAKLGDASSFIRKDFRDKQLKKKAEKIVKENNEPHEKINLEIEFSDKEKALRINKELQETLKKASSLKQELAGLIVKIHQRN